MDNGLVTGDGTKVLTVEEYDKFLQFIPEKKPNDEKPNTYRPAFELNVITGLRYIELQRLHDNPDWYHKERNQIILPKEAQKKVKQKQIKRTIDKLPSTFSYLFKAFLEAPRPPHRDSWNKNLKRWSERAGIEPKIGPKTPRKTIESWMLKCGIPEIEIYGRQGHDPVTSLRHYQSLSFTEYEMRDIEKRLREWGILRK